MAKYQEKQMVEFKDYQDLKHYVGIIGRVIHSQSDPLTDYWYVLNGVNFGMRENSKWDSGVKDGVQVMEGNIIRVLEEMSVGFLLKNGWFISKNSGHPQDFYVKNKYPIGFHYDKEKREFWIYDSRINNPSKPFLMNPITNEKEYDDLIIPILKELKENDR